MCLSNECLHSSIKCSCWQVLVAAPYISQRITNMRRYASSIHRVVCCCITPKRPTLHLDDCMILTYAGTVARSPIGSTVYRAHRATTVPQLTPVVRAWSGIAMRRRRHGCTSASRHRSWSPQLENERCCRSSPGSAEGFEMKKRPPSTAPAIAAPPFPSTG